MKKLLLIQPFIAHPLSSGGRTRIYHTIDQLRQYFELTVWQFTSSQEESTTESSWLNKLSLPFKHFNTQPKQFFSFFKCGLPYWFSDWWNLQIVTSLKNEATNFPLIQIEFSQLLYLVKYLPKKSQKIFVAHDLASLSFWRRLGVERNPLKVLLHFWRLIEVYFYERKYLPQFDLVIAMSETDKKILQEKFAVKNVLVIANCLEKIDFLPIRKNPSILKLGMIGSFNHPPNLTAFQFTCQKLLPDLDKEAKIELLLAGDNEPALVNKILKQADLVDSKIVINLGFQADLKNFYQEIDLLVAPLFAGSGTRIKILEALSYGRPVLTSEMGAEGLSIKSPLLTVISNSHANDPNIWLKQLVSFKANYSQSDLADLIKQLSSLTWQEQFKNYTTIL